MRVLAWQIKSSYKFKQVSRDGLYSEQLFFSVSSLQGSQSLVHTVRTVYTGCNHFTPFYLASVKLHEKNSDLYHSQSFATGHRYLSFANHEKIPEWYPHGAILGHSSSSLICKILQDSIYFDSLGAVRLTHSRCLPL